VTTVTPLITATIGGHPLRFFKSPLNDGRPDFPWHVADDLSIALHLNRAQRRVILAKHQQWGGGGTPRTIATTDGVVVVAPHFMAQGVIAAAIESGWSSASIRADYDHAATEAVGKLMHQVGLIFPSDQWMAWMKAALHRHGRPVIA
jgi:hypothetical protein